MQGTGEGSTTLNRCASCARTGVARCWMLANLIRPGSSAGVTQIDSGAQ